MISSEVQRTLVKSPPELWSELSDPESLASHLGELGEITITRTEPENLVEWEAEGTTGTVEIKPSGWGTRVTLTVLRDVPAEPEAETLQPEAGAGEGEPAADPSAEASTVQAGDSAGDAAQEDRNGSEPVPETPPVESRDLHRPDPERRPAPATEAARRAAGWPSATPASGPAIESDLRAAEAVDGPPAEPHGLDTWAAQSLEATDAPEADGEPDLTPPPRAEPPRRGFFARLFGRRRRAVEAEPAQEPLELELDADTIATDEAPAGDAVSAEEDLEPDASIEDEPAQDAAPDLGAALQALGEPEPEQLTAEAHYAPDAETHGTAAEAQGEFEIDVPALADEADPEPDLEPHAAGEEPETDTLAHADGADDQPGQELHADAAEATEAEAGAPDLGDAGIPSSVQDLAAELRAAEEIAAEQVEAVLTAVLDRLGAAHHRPFSRP